MTSMSYIFISYSHKDKDYAHKLHQHLFEHGFNAWIDDRIDYGSRWPDEVEKRVNGCDVFILLMSPNSKQSDWVQSELELAKRLNKTIYTFLLEGENWWYLHTIQYLDVRQGEMPPVKFIASLSKIIAEVQEKDNSNVSINIGGNVQGNIVVGDGNKVQSIENLGIKPQSQEKSEQESSLLNEDPDLYKFIEIPKDKKEVPYTFYIGKYPVTNTQYERFLNTSNFSKLAYWTEFPKYDENFQRIGDRGGEGIIWLRKELKKLNEKILFPRYWDDANFGISNPNNPVVGVSWFEANAYCEWLFQNWNTLLESKANFSLKPQSIRLPLETEWQKAAGGITPEGRYAWDETDKKTTSLKQILYRANVNESEINKTTPVDTYPLGKSPYGVMDMSGNIWEWQANYYDSNNDIFCLRGGSFSDEASDARVVVRVDNDDPLDFTLNFGFRVVCAIPNE